MLACQNQIASSISGQNKLYMLQFATFWPRKEIFKSKLTELFLQVQLKKWLQIIFLQSQKLDPSF